ncbi:MAG: hypothetical protein ACXABN_15390 [Candidatus Thorarchaeota archaeon]|jgi:hypothetical protein
MDREQVNEIKIVWDKNADRENPSTIYNRGVFIDGKELPVAAIGVDIGPMGKDYVTFKIHAYRVQFDIDTEE